MATRQEIENMRITLYDPPGVLDIQTVADEAALPTDAETQTAYFDVARGKYWVAGDGAKKYEIAELQVSDNEIETNIDDLGVGAAKCELLSLMTRGLGHKMLVVKEQVGTDSTQMQSLKDMYAYYKGMSEDCSRKLKSAEEAPATSSSGRYIITDDPIIAGGNL